MPRTSIPSLLPICLLSLACGAPAAQLKTHPLTTKVQSGIAQGKGSFDHAEFDRLLGKHVSSEALVDYGALMKERAGLKSYLARIAAADVSGLSRPELLAFLINAYNAYTLDLILEHYPVQSIRKLPGVEDPWQVEFCVVGGEKVDLNFIEHQLLRPRELFDDPRIHFAVNCASIGCPPLRRRAYTGPGIDRELEEATRACLGDRRYVEVRGARVQVSRIFDWFGGDFGGKHGGVTEFLRPRVEAAAAKLLEEQGAAALEFLDYDWDLNDVVRGK